MSGQPVFSIVNGREIYECGGQKKWRCPSCKWWREWDEVLCPACGEPREAINEQP